MQSWLKSTKEAFHKNAAADIPSAALIVLGNQSADVDSIASAIGYAYFLSRGSGWDTPSHPGRRYAPVVPVVNIPREELANRPECIHLLPPNIMDELFYWPDLALDREPKISLALVDHNTPEFPQRTLSERVVALIDHHDDKRHFPEARPRIVEPVGSCSSLVTIMFMQGRIDIPEELAKMLLGAILLDTGRLSRKKFRTTEKDKQAAEYLRTFAQVGGSWKRFYRDLYEKKVNISNMSTKQLLSKDFKAIEIGSLVVGTSTIGLPWSHMKKRDDLLSACSAFITQRQLDLELMLNTWSQKRKAYNDISGDSSSGDDGEEHSATSTRRSTFQRQLVILSTNNRLAQQVTSELQKVAELDLRPTKEGPTFYEAVTTANRELTLMAFEQSAVMSRKMIIPILKETLAEL